MTSTNGPSEGNGPAASLAPMEHPSVWTDDDEFRAYPLDGVTDTESCLVLLSAVRALLRADSREIAAAVLHTAVRDLAGIIVPATESDSWTLPVDISLGVTEPLVVTTGHLPAVKQQRLERELPRLVEDALLVAGRCDRASREPPEAILDPVTGFPARDEMAGQFAATRAGDVVCRLHLRSRDTAETVSDELLSQFATLLRNAVRKADFLNRFTDEQFLVVLRDLPVAAALNRVTRIMHDWAEAAGTTTAMTCGFAPVDARGAEAAAAAAGQAALRLREDGGNRVALATQDDYERSKPA